MAITRILTEDGQGIYMDGGIMPTWSPDRLDGQQWQEDLLLPRMWDANGHEEAGLHPAVG